jgi:hypothetical protein
MLKNIIFSLEIKKTLVNLSEKNVKLEMFDTNSSILMSPMIKAYLKISNAFILICENSEPDSIQFLEKQIENIINYSNNPKNFFLIINDKNKILTNPSLSHIIQSNQILQNFVNKYSINLNRIELINNLYDGLNSITDKFKKFFIKCLMRKKSKSVPSGKKLYSNLLTLAK